MKHFIGIDLGTTNSAICSFDGTDTRVWKSPEQNDVTPSAIYEDRHQRRFYGRRAYEMAPFDEKNSATLFKRYLGTSMKYTFAGSNTTLTPEECSAEILRLLCGYLPDEWRGSPDTATVITVPAAFNQMKKDATLNAANIANIGNVALMQEPVAAVMSAMKTGRIDGLFVVYDLGGGTFDVSVAEHRAGRVNMLAQGGREMCGGRDWDRMLWRSVALPWLREHFNLPENVETSPEYRRLRQLALYACEQAKIELSLRDEAYIQLDETRVGQRDLDGADIYFDVRLDRAQLNKLVNDLIDTTVNVARETVQKAGVQLRDINRIVFIGGPTQYPPLQQRVMDKLGIRVKGDADPMTAVAEGASIYCESIDWSDELHARQKTIGRAQASDYDVRYESRVSGDQARVGFRHERGEDFFAELTSLADGWSSGQISMHAQGAISVPLAARGANTFRLRLYDAQRQPVPLSDDEITINRVLATVNAIPASHSIALKVLDKADGHPVPLYIVRENEQLPKRGQVTLRAGKRLIAGSNESLVFTLWEGDIADPIEDNRYIGLYRIPGISFTTGIINVGAEIICEYEISESGTLRLGAAVPSVGAVFANENYYSRTEGQLNIDDTANLMAQANALQARIMQMQSRMLIIELLKLHPRLEEIKRSLNTDDPETIQQAANDLLECQKQVALYRQKNLSQVRLTDLEGYKAITDQFAADLSEGDKAVLNELYDAVRRAADHNPDEYESALHQYRVRSWTALMHSKRFIKQQFEARIARPDDYTDRARFDKIKAAGQQAIENDGDYLQLLTGLIGELGRMEKPEVNTSSENMFEKVNVFKS